MQHRDDEELGMLRACTCTCTRYTQQRQEGVHVIKGRKSQKYNERQRELSYCPKPAKCEYI